MAFVVEVPKHGQKDKFYELRFERVVGKARANLSSQAVTLPKRVRAQAPPAGMDVDATGDGEKAAQDHAAGTGGDVVMQGHSGEAAPGASADVLPGECTW